VKAIWLLIPIIPEAGGFVSQFWFSWVEICAATAGCEKRREKAGQLAGFLKSAEATKRYGAKRTAD
jgi:hypothetical protein